MPLARIRVGTDERGTVAMKSMTSVAWPRLRLAWILALAVLAASSVAGSQLALAQTAPPTTDKPDSSAVAERIVSLGGDATEILYALGLSDSIVAVDSTSVEPPDALKQKANVGYMRQLSAEGVLSTGATSIVANAQAGPPEVVSALSSANLRFLVLPGNESPDNVAEKVRLVGKAFGREREALKLVSAIEAGLKAAAQKRERIAKPVRALFILGVNNGRATIGGAKTTADTMLHLAGAINAAAGLVGYKPLTDEALLGLAPDVVVTMRREGATDSRQLIGALPGYKQTPAGKHDRLIEMEAHYLLGFGPRTHEAALELMARLYPEMVQ
jgi:iron complex transport system substrate-binding protein